MTTPRGVCIGYCQGKFAWCKANAAVAFRRDIGF
jgi:hypothetical protein